MELRAKGPCWDLKSALERCCHQTLVGLVQAPHLGLGDSQTTPAIEASPACVIQCLLALPDRTEARQRAVFLQPCDDQPCGQRLCLLIPKNLPNSPNVQLDARGLRWPIRACCEARVATTWTSGGALGIPRISRRQAWTFSS